MANKNITWILWWLSRSLVMMAVVVENCNQNRLSLYFFLYKWKPWFKAIYYTWHNHVVVLISCGSLCAYGYIKKRRMEVLSVYEQNHQDRSRDNTVAQPPNSLQDYFSSSPHYFQIIPLGILLLLHRVGRQHSTA